MYTIIVDMGQVYVNLILLSKLFLCLKSPTRSMLQQHCINVYSTKCAYWNNAPIVCHCPDGTARQCSPLRRKFMMSSIINPALSLLMKHLVIGHHQKAPNLSAFHWSLHGSLVLYWSAFRNHEGSTFTEKDRNKLNYRIGPNRT